MSAPETTMQGIPTSAPHERRPDDGAADSLRLTVNGEARRLAAATTLGALLRAHDLDPRLVVVELNREILRDRASFDGLVLADGDALELVHFVGGG